VTVEENSRKRPYNKNVHAPDGQVWCRTCKSHLPKSSFNADRQRFNGLYPTCRMCHGKANRIYRQMGGAASA